MPPQVPVLAQSENKSKFLERLDISDRTDEGKRTYNMMKEEAIAGRARMSASSASLNPELVDDPNVRPPYSNTQISETAMHRETLEIYRLAKPETRRYYELGHYIEGETEDNWIIRWLLWHVFRYRDNRNRGRAVPSWTARSAPVSEQAVDVTTLQARVHITRPREHHHRPSFTLPELSPLSLMRTNSDTTRDFDVSSLSSGRTTATQSLAASPEESRQFTFANEGASRPASSPGYWDPVRDAQRYN